MEPLTGPDQNFVPFSGRGFRLTEDGAVEQIESPSFSHDSEYDEVPPGQESGEPHDESQHAEQTLEEREAFLNMQPANAKAKGELTDCMIVASSWIAKGELHPDLSARLEDWVLAKTITLTSDNLTFGECSDGVIEFAFLKEDVDEKKAATKGKASSSSSTARVPPTPPPPPPRPARQEQAEQNEDLDDVIDTLCEECGISEVAPKRRRVTTKKKEKKEW